MPTIDLGTTATEPAHGAGALDALPQRVTLTLTELLLAARLAGDAPLPFDLPGADSAVGDEATPALEGRLGESPATTDHHAWVSAVEALRDPETTLARRGLVTDGVLDRGLAGAIGLLATPRVAVDLDLSVGSTQLRAWHRQAGEAVATLATADAVVFELAWLTTSHWPAELARVARLPEEFGSAPSVVPGVVVLPYELADAAAEATGGGRSDLLDRLAERFQGAVLDADGRPMERSEVAILLGGLSTEAQGRLRVLVARVDEAPALTIGVRSWTLLADGWRSLQPAGAGSSSVRLAGVRPDDLAADLAPVLSEALA